MFNWIRKRFKDHCWLCGKPNETAITEGLKVAIREMDSLRKINLCMAKISVNLLDNSNWILEDEQCAELDFILSYHETFIQGKGPEKLAKAFVKIESRYL